MIIDLGRWVFAEACRQLHDWHQRFPQHADLNISVNLSNRQVTDPDLVSDIRTALAETGVRSECIGLEITESMMMDDVGAAIELMSEFKVLGLKLAVDDFGTGYSSLSYLHRFPLDTLKVDRSFVGRLEQSDEDRAIIQTILTLGQGLGMKVVAEGIETSDQLALLKERGCDYGQRFLFAKPIPADQAEALIARQLA